MPNEDETNLTGPPDAEAATNGAASTDGAPTEDAGTVDDSSSADDAAPVDEPPEEVGGDRPTSGDGHDALPAASAQVDDRQEIRLALVMTGGVSLAVWMGGAVAEFDRIARGVGPYGAMLDLVDATVKVDVIGGTSAGGVNGGLLALGLVRGADLAALRSAWLDLGSFRAMLRLPTEEHPPSLLRGDDYFLGRLRDAYGLMASAGPPSDPAENPMHLVMTTTLLRGEHRVFQDDYGGRIQDLSHRATFSFVRGEDWGRDDFAQPGIVESLSLASRATASFPGAFEPTFAPIGAEDAQGRPDMAAHADFAHGGYVMDGAVLTNKPIGEVVDVLRGRQTEGRGRRILAYVIPDPNVPVTPPDPDGATPVIPPMARAIGSSMQIPRVESVAPDLEMIRTHNRQVTAQRRLRESLLRAGGLDPSDLATQVFPAYLGTRREYRVRWILDLLARGLRLPTEGETGGVRSWDRSAVSLALSRSLERHLPQGFPGGPEDMAGWTWDIAGVKGALGVASHLLRIALDLPVADETPGVDRRALLQGRRELDAVRHSLQRLRRDEEAYWTGDRVRRLREAMDAPKSAREDRLGEWAAASFAACPSVQRAGEVADMATRIASSVATTGPTDSAMRTLRWILAVVVVQSAFSGSEPEVEQVIELLQVSADTPNAFDDRDTGPEKLAGLQLGHFGAFYKRSWRANDWMWGRLDAVGSLMRVALEPTRLRRLAARDPGFAERFEGGLKALALGEDGSAARSVLREPWDEGRFAWELTFLHDQTVPVPRALDWCIRAVQRRIQLEILEDELPRVAAAARQDMLEGAADRETARAFIHAVHDGQQPPASPDAAEKGAKPRGRHAAPDGERKGRRRRLGPPPEVDPNVSLPPAAALSAFAECRVGEERIEDEAGTPLYVETMNAVAAVGLRAARRHVQETNEALGHQPPPKVTLAVLLPLLRSVAASSTATFWVMAVLVLGGAGLLAYGLWSESVRWGATVGGAVLAALGLAIAFVRMRRGRIFASLGVIAAAAALLAVSYSTSDGSLSKGWFRGAVIGVAAVLIVLLGYRRRRAPKPATVPAPPPPPSASAPPDGSSARTVPRATTWASGQSYRP